MSLFRNRGTGTSEPEIHKVARGGDETLCMRTKATLPERKPEQDSESSDAKGISNA